MPMKSIYNKTLIPLNKIVVLDTTGRLKQETIFKMNLSLSLLIWQLGKLLQLIWQPSNLLEHLHYISFYISQPNGRESTINRALDGSTYPS
jgi:hypothetical protein